MERIARLVIVNHMMEQRHIEYKKTDVEVLYCSLSHRATGYQIFKREPIQWSCSGPQGKGTFLVK